MINIKGHEIHISRGDTANITVNLHGNGSVLDGAIAVITLKPYPIIGEEHIWEKTETITDSAFTIRLAQNDTNIPSGMYFWDVRLIINGERIHTPMQPAIFEIMEVVGDVE